ncbi:pectin lyase fold/virulence factor [Asticcacaulis biprosthecium C19]|uniref:Pectin lyase fold/virulence factor n=1 Tax=Asticcacaulis biprosthecium C19 TaxID=715226 RepID=F4QSJ4_9CAUL|nr:right-handed parallel beta-helix repeat-containing protein [Asticcacaulis biprosthecium]EGF89714.1 pectin lyase fold/virulence factor [Asticcacaulis biprosthecium C19]
MSRLLVLTLAALAVATPAYAQTKWDRPATTFHVSPKGDDRSDGSAARPYQTLMRAKEAVRTKSATSDVAVSLADGTYLLEAPLILTEADGGQNGFSVTWQAADGAKPALSGGLAITGWKPYRDGIYVADTPKGLDTRQLWVNDRLAEVAQVEIDRKSVTFSETGLTIANPPVNLAALPAQDRIEIESQGYFTARFSPVKSIAGNTLTMQQPAWANNIWGWDTIPNPFHPEDAHLYLRNSLAFLTQPGQWFLDPGAGKLYYKPRAGEDMTTAQVVLPRLEVLLAVAGTKDKPVHDLNFRGLRFSHTSWRGPSSNQGLASQQSGTFITGKAAFYPEDVLDRCKTGCAEFETVRNQWNQTPAAVQVSAAQHIVFEGNVFAHLGQYALGIGNDDNAHLTGQGLAAVDIVVKGNVFTDLAGGAISAGGVRPDAHHPSDPRLTNRQHVFENNLIQNVSQDYKDNSAIIATYIWNNVILHNDISGAPYDAIDVGYGWGYVDAGGNPNYRTRMRGYDQWPGGGGNPVYDTPTTHKDVFVGFNRVYKIKQLFLDGGAIYNLGACPDCVFAENHVFDIGPRVALYFDEGSRGLLIRNNVVEDASKWLNVNTARSALPLRTSTNNTARGNWHNTTEVGGIWSAYQEDLIVDDHDVPDKSWPAEAKQVMANAGVQDDIVLPDYKGVKPRPKAAGLPPSNGSPTAEKTRK